MTPLVNNSSFLIMGVLVFVATLLLLEALYMLWKSHHGPQAKKLNRRLQVLSASRDKSAQTRLLRQRMLSELPAFERFLARVPRLRGLDRAITQAGLDWSVSKLLLGCAFCAVIAWFGVGSVAHQGLVLGAIAGVAAATLPMAFVFYRRARRLGRIQRQLPDALDLMTRALRAGHAFSSALKMTGEEMAEPIAGEFRAVHDEVNFGVSLQQALTHLADRVPLMDLRYFVVAVLIQRESGGNLTEILANLSRLIRERLKLYAKIKVLSSEGRLSAWVLGLMPFALAGVMNLVNPGFMSPLWKDPIGIAIVQYMLGLMAIGAIILVKIVKIRV